MTTETKTDSAEAGRGQLEKVKELVSAMKLAQNSRQTTGVDTEAEDAEEEAREAIQADALSVEVRSGWYDPSAKDADKEPADFRIVLGFGGPNVEIVGTLDADMEPETATLRHSWATPWANLPISGDDEEALLAYASCFYFGE